MVDANGTVIDNSDGSAVNGTGVDANGTAINNGAAGNGTVIVNGTECPAPVTVTVVRHLPVLTCSVA